MTMQGVAHIWISLLLLYITASEGGYEYIHCPNEFTYKIQNTTCYLNPYCPDEYIYITSTLVSNKEYHSCKETDHQFEEWSSSPSDELLVYWRESEGVYIILKINADITDPIIFTANFTCPEETHARHWVELVVITIEKIEVYLHYQRLNLYNKVQIVCSSNYQDQDCDLYGPNGIIHTDCTSDGCQVTLSLINSGQYYCELRLDGFSIKSDPEPINITDTTPAQPIITTAPPDPSVYTIIISLGSVGGLELIAVIVVAILLCVFIILYCRHRGQNGYQQIPNVVDGGGQGAGGGGGGQGGDGAVGADRGGRQ